MRDDKAKRDTIITLVSILATLILLIVGGLIAYGSPKRMCISGPTKNVVECLDALDRLTYREARTP